MRRSMTGTLVILAVFLITGGDHLLGQRQGETISLEEALTIARRSNRELHLAVLRQKAEHEKINQVWGKLYPVLESEASLLRQGARTGFMSISDGQYDIKLVQLKFGINPGMFYHALVTSREAYRAATEEVRRVRMEMEYAVIKSYFDLILAHELLDLRLEAQKLLGENLKDVNNLYRTGSVPQYDVLQAQVKLLAANPLVIEAENRRRIALQLFNYHLGLDGTVYTADRKIQPAENLKTISPDIDRESERLGIIAMKRRPEVIQLTIKKNIMRHQADISQSQYLWPTFTAGGSYGFNQAVPGTVHADVYTPVGPARADLSQIAGDGKWQQNWQVRIAATYRWGALLPIDSSRAEERESRIRVIEAEEELNRIKRLIGISIKSALSNLITAHQTINSQRENIKKSEEGLRIARESFRSGVIKNTDLLAAQLAVAEAKTGYINSINSYHTSLAQIRREIGAEDDAIIFGGNSHGTESAK